MQNRHRWDDGAGDLFLFYFSFFGGGNGGLQLSEMSPYAAAVSLLFVHTHSTRKRQEGVESSTTHGE